MISRLYNVQHNKWKQLLKNRKAFQIERLALLLVKIYMLYHVLSIGNKNFLVDLNVMKGYLWYHYWIKNNLAKVFLSLVKEGISFTWGITPWEVWEELKVLGYVIPRAFCLDKNTFLDVTNGVPFKCTKWNLQVVLNHFSLP